MKRMKYICIAILAILVLSCKQDVLIFPAQDLNKKVKEPIDVLVKPSDVVIIGGHENSFIFQWPTFSDKVAQVRIVYEEEEGKEEILVSDFTNNLVLYTAKTGDYKFTMNSIGKNGVESPAVINVIRNKGIYINELLQFIGASVSNMDIHFTWSNPLARDLEFSFSHTSGAGEQITSFNNADETGEFYINASYGDHIDLQIKDALGNTVSKRVSYKLKIEELLSKEQKEGWVAAVSSNQVNDGGGAPALIDGAADTFWHTPWHSPIPPWPHHATISFDKELHIIAFMLSLRHNNGSAAPKDIDFEISEDGLNFETQESFINTEVGNGKTLVFNLDKPISSKYVRFMFKTSVRNSQFMSLAEISFKVRSLEIND